MLHGKIKRKEVRKCFLDKNLELNDTELDIYNYIVANLDKVVYMRIRDLATEAHVSTTTILRFAENLVVMVFRSFG